MRFNSSPEAGQSRVARLVRSSPPKQPPEARLHPLDLDDQADGAPPAPSATGRGVTTEILISTPAVANLVATGKSAQLYSAIEGGQSAGMQTLEQDLARLWATGRITETAAVAMARNPNVLRDRFEIFRRRGPAVQGRGRVP